MTIMRNIILILVLLLLALAIWLYVSPPALLRVGTNYAAKIVCSNVFIAGRDAETVLAEDVQAPGHPILKFVSADVDEEAKSVTARLIGFVAPATSIYRPGLGCTNTQGTEAARLAVSAPADLPEPAPLPTAIDPETQAVIEDDTLAGAGMRAIVVLQDGEVIAERYADGFDATTPLLGWSMTKTVTAVLIGQLEKAGVLSREDTALFPKWADDARAKIALADLLGMSSDLTWNEGYGSVSDVTRMLYLEPDMSAFVSDAALTTPDGSQIGQTWEYSSGTTVLLSDYWQRKVGPDAVNLPRQALFQPLGMTSAVMEPDAAGTLAGGSYMYASARDWARFGQFLLQDGVWNGERLLPEGYVSWMMEEHPASNGHYTRGQMWSTPPRRKEVRDEPVDSSLNNTVWLAGHDGQSVGIDRARGLVVVRLGLTPEKHDYRPEHLMLAVQKSLSQ